MPLEKVLSFDTETELIADRPTLAGDSGDTAGPLSKSGGRIFTGPFVHPDVVLGTVQDCAGGAVLLGPAELAKYLRWRLDDGWHIVTHNAPFDVGVMTKAFPDLIEPFMHAAEEGRLHDTKVLDQLYGLAVGRYDKPKFDPITGTWDTPELKPRSLDTIAQDYCGMRLNKDPNIRLGFGQFKGRVDEVPEDFAAYAKQDAVATLRVFRELERRLEAMGAENFLSEPIQVRCDLVIADMEGRGVRVDPVLGEELRVRFVDMVLPLKIEMAAAGLGVWKPVSKTTVQIAPEVGCLHHTQARCTEWAYHEGALYRAKVLKKSVRWQKAQPAFSLSTAALQAALGALGLPAAPLRDDGTLGLSYDHWAPKIPGDHRPLQAWLEYCKLQKILSTYLNVYSRARRVFPRWWGLGARTGRMSASCPSLQNVPKRRYGIRALFVPDEGKVFTKCDYTAQEMYTLDQMMLDMGIRGRLHEVLSDTSVDFHIAGAAIVLEKKPSEVTKLERQGQKALHFGVPGGLGKDKLAAYAYNLYGLNWTPDEAGRRRQSFLNAFPDVNEYLKRMKEPQEDILRRVTGLGRFEWAHQLELNDWNVIKAMATHENPQVRALGIECERQLLVKLRTGFRRGCCSFTEGANCGFQGLAAAVTKEAAWNAMRSGLEVVLVVHDEIVIQHIPELTDFYDRELKDCMLGAFCKVCPDVGRYAKVELTTGLDRWGPATDRHGKILTLDMNAPV